MNVCTNPGFETDLTGWTIAKGTETMTRDTVEFHSGVASCEVVTPGNVVDEGIFFLLSHVLGMGEVLTARVWVKGSGQLDVWAATRNGGLYQNFTKQTVVLTSSWQQVQAQVTKTLAQDQIEVRIGTDNDVAAQAVTFYVDDVELVVPDAVVDPPGALLLLDVGASEG